MRIVEQLHRSGEAVTVSEEFADSTTLAILVGWGVTTVAPFGSSAQTLTVAGLFEARAVVCVVDDELANLEISLVAREMHPDVRVVTQLGNQGIGRAMADGDGGTVLDVADLAAPAIVEACLGRHIHEIPIGEETFLVATLPVEQSSTLRGLYGDLAPVAVVRQPPRRRRAPVIIECPGRDFEVRPATLRPCSAARPTSGGSASNCSTVRPVRGGPSPRHRSPG